MRGGKLDLWIAIQRAVVTQSPSGEPIETWSTLSTRPALFEPVTGDERFATAQLIAKTQFSFTIRWATIVDDVSPRDRIVCPASALNNSPSDPLRATIYNIISVQPIGRNEGLKIFATVKQDESN